MSIVRAVPAISTRLLAAACAAAALLTAQPARAQEPLSFFKNYFVTGDYAVSGVSLFGRGRNGVAQAAVSIAGFPEDSVDVVAAFLYVQTAEEVQWTGINRAKFNGYDLGPGTSSFAKALNPAFQTRVCYLKAADPHRMVTYRADVLRFLPVKANGKLAVNGAHSVALPDAGFSWNDDAKEVSGTGPHPVGASLVIVYRDPSKPLKAIVIYDGGFTKPAADTMTQPIRGYFDSSSGSPVAKAARMSAVAGIGTPLLSDKVFLDGTQVARNAFASSSGALWDNPTFENIPLPADSESVTVRVAPDGTKSDCLTVSAMVLSTTVQDTDGDGLLDKWETSNNLIDPNDRTGMTLLPDLKSMGADPNAKDIFIEVGYMQAADGTTYGGIAKPGHTHLPTLEAIDIVGKSFRNAPVANPNLTTGINVHFDVGNNYQTTPLNPFIIPAALARGGRNISETKRCTATAPDGAVSIVECPPGQMAGQYPAYPGTVGWKTGFRFLRDEILGFDRNRKDAFRSLLSAHAVGMPREACLNADNTANVTCQNTNPDFHVPRTNSGIADFPGGDLLMTLGAFDDATGRPVGTSFMQAATMAHEFGHTVELTHAGAPQVPREANCKPNYLSVMNYLFQLRGLPDANGEIRMDFSSEVNPALNESALFEAPVGSQLYRTGWYAPKNTSYLRFLGHAAIRHCDGTPLTDAEKDDLLPPDAAHPDRRGGMVRVDAPSVLGPIDWNANGVLLDGVSQDINFNGVIDGDPNPVLKPSSSDWANLRLDQLGGRRSVGGYYIDLAGRNAVGPLSLDIGRGDIGRGDIGRGDIGRGDIGRGDIGRGDIGRGDIGRGDIGRGDIGRGDIGRGYEGGGDLDVGSAAELREAPGDIDLETAKAVEGNAPTPPSGLKACLTSDGQCTSAGGSLPVRLSWSSPTFGKPVAYGIYRFPFQGAFAAPSDLPIEPLATIVMGEAGGAPPTTYVDSNAPAGSQLAYFVRARFDDNSLSGISNFSTVTTPVQTLVDFEQFTGRGETFGAADPPLTVGIATFSGGQIIGASTANLPADPTVVYGTASFCAGCARTITIDFATAVSDFSVFLMNGQPATVEYTIQDNFGGTDTWSLVSNAESGAKTISLPIDGIVQVVITPSGTPESWDFLIDNVRFTAPPQ